MDDTEMLARCEKAWEQARSSGKKCRVYSRFVGHCGDCSFSYFRKRTLLCGRERFNGMTAAEMCRAMGPEELEANTRRGGLAAIAEGEKLKATNQNAPLN